MKGQISVDSDGQRGGKEKGLKSLIPSQNHGFEAKNATGRYRIRTYDPLIKSQLTENSKSSNRSGLGSEAIALMVHALQGNN